MLPPMPADLTLTDEDTPNPNAWKFTANRVINPGPTRAYYKPEDAQADPLAAALFALTHVVGVMILNDFVTVSKAPAGRWNTLKPKIIAVLRQHLPQEAEAL